MKYYIKTIGCDHGARACICHPKQKVKLKVKVKAMLLLVAALTAGVAQAAEPGPAAKKEIQYLFSRLEGSGCQFLRNGRWYSAKDASSHLQKKYKYLLDKGMISTAESFIEQGATDSSMSSKPYRVRCGSDGKIEASGLWFAAELAKYRQSGK